MRKPKVYVAYLPQYHITEDNNKFWGNGFTDWESVKNAKPLFDSHNQPRVPLNDNYYSLLDYRTIKWQADLARNYGVDGFNIYHYWFKNGKQELEKPAEILLDHQEIDIGYFFTWDNCAWKRSWSKVRGNDWAPLFETKNQLELKESSVLIDFEYGDERQWIQHFNYLLNFFKDSRYLKIDNRPVFAFMTTTDPIILTKMTRCWDELAKKHGFNGMYHISQRSFYINKVTFENTFVYEPINSAWGRRKSIYGIIKKYFHFEPIARKPAQYMYDYTKVWKRILKNTKKTSCIHSCFVRYDDTPRRGCDAGIVLNESPEIFSYYFKQFYEICMKKGDPFIIIVAWNEWGEGAYFEPDKDSGYAFLEALKSSLLRVER